MGTHYESSGKRKKSKLEQIFEKIESGATDARNAVGYSDPRTRTIDALDKKRKKNQK